MGKEGEIRGKRGAKGGGTALRLGGKGVAGGRGSNSNSSYSVSKALTANMRNRLQFDTTSSF